LEVTHKEKADSTAKDSVAYDGPPEMVGGYDFVRNNLKYPENARKNCLEAQVKFQIVVDEKGDVIQAVALQDDKGWGFNDAGLAVLKKSKWKPVTQKGQPAKCRVLIPIAFRLK
jgi:protein TonB